MICPLELFIIESNNERTDNEMENSVTKREKISYGLYFMGQNVFYGLVGYMTTYFTDIGCDRGAYHESVGCHQRSDLRYDHG